MKITLNYILLLFAFLLIQSCCLNPPCDGCKSCCPVDRQEDCSSNANGTLRFVNNENSIIYVKYNHYLQSGSVFNMDNPPALTATGFIPAGVGQAINLPFAGAGSYAHYYFYRNSNFSNASCISKLIINSSTSSSIKFCPINIKSVGTFPSPTFELQSASNNQCNTLLTYHKQMINGSIIMPNPDNTFSLKRITNNRSESFQNPSLNDSHYYFYKEEKGGNRGDVIGKLTLYNSNPSQLRLDKITVSW